MTNKEKYKKAFDVLASSEQISLEVENMANKKRKKSFMAITVAAVIVFGTLTVGAAAYYNWSNGLSEELRIDEEKQKMLEDTGMAAFSEVSCTDAGVTVTAQQSITDNYYTCTDKILGELGKMYVDDERFKRNIDKAGGEGTAEFVKRAIEIHCAR